MRRDTKALRYVFHSHSLLACASIVTSHTNRMVAFEDYFCLFVFNFITQLALYVTCVVCVAHENVALALVYSVPTVRNS